MEIFAYLDPGTGSIIIQAVIGAVVGIGVAVKAYWLKISSLFGGRTKPETKKDLRK